MKWFSGNYTDQRLESGDAWSASDFALHNRTYVANRQNAMDILLFLSMNVIDLNFHARRSLDVMLVDGTDFNIRGGG
jgi:hypothetical protein